MLESNRPIPSDFFKIPIYFFIFFFAVFVLIFGLDLLFIFASILPIILVLVFGFAGFSAEFRKLLFTLFRGFWSLALGNPLISFLIALLFLGGLFFFRPWFHATFMLFYTNLLLYPLFLFIFLFLILSLLSLIVPSFDSLSPVFSGLSALGLLSFVLVVASLLLGGVLLQSSIVSATTYEKVSSLPNSTDYRLLPFEVAQTYFSNTLAESNKRVGTMHISFIDGKLSWAAPKDPNGWLLSLTEKPEGILIADATTSSKNITVKNQQLEFGEDIQVFDNLYWNIYNRDYLMDASAVFYATDNEGNLVSIVPITRYRYHFLAMMPYFDGVYVIDSDGTITAYSPDAIQTTPWLKELPLFPESLARQYIESFQYKGGVLNAWFYHEDQIQIAELPGYNQQPLLMSTQDGLKWVVSAEASGETTQSRGIFKIFMMNATDGSIEYFEPDTQSSLLGPVAALSYAKKENPLIDWSYFDIIEPRPYFLKGDLYWLSSVVPYDHTGVSYTVLSNARTAEVKFFKTDAEVKSFLEGNIPLIPPTDSNQPIVPTNSTLIDQINSIQNTITELEQQIQELNRTLQPQ